MRIQECTHCGKIDPQLLVAASQIDLLQYALHNIIWVEHRNGTLKEAIDIAMSALGNSLIVER